MVIWYGSDQTTPYLHTHVTTTSGRRLGSHTRAGPRLSGRRLGSHTRVGLFKFCLYVSFYVDTYSVSLTTFDFCFKIFALFSVEESFLLF